jgi:D-amino peptidase
MKIFLSHDMEGTAGIVDWSQCRAGTPAYEMGRALLLGEVNAAIDGAFEAGATELCCNDSHGAMANLDASTLHHRASYLSGRHKPRYMMEGLDATYDAVFLVSYHGSMGSAGVLSHTYNPRAIMAVRCNGITVGESGVNALVANAYGVPVALITGDQVTIEEAAPVLPAIEGVVVKRATGRFAAESLHPELARAAIAEGARRAVQRVRAGEIAPPPIALPATLEIDWYTADMAEMVTVLRGCERISTRTVAISDDDPLRLFETFITAVLLTRAIVEA